MKVVLVVLMMMLISGFVQPVFCEETVLNPADVPRMTKEELKAKLGHPDLVIIDVRSAHDWENSEIKIKGSVREDGHKVDSWINKYPKNKTVVLYCKWVKEATSVRVALQLIKEGYKSVYALKGGWADWESEKYPVEPKEP